MQITLSVLVVVALSFAEAKSISDEPAFCNRIECPHFKTINKTDKYEVRSYPTPYKWASTVVAGMKFALLVSAANGQLGRLLLNNRSNAVTREKRSNEKTTLRANGFSYADARRLTSNG